MDLLLLQAGLDAVSDGVALFDPDARLVLANSRFCALFPGSAASIMPGQTYEVLLRRAVEAGDILYPVDLDADGYVRQQLAGFRAPGPPFEFRLRDGRIIRGLDRRQSDGSTVCIRSDLSALRRCEQGLADSDARHRQLLELSPGGIIIHDQRGIGRFINRAGRRMLGLDEADNIGRLTLLHFTPPETRPLVEALLRRVLTGEVIRQRRLPMRRRDGTVITLELSFVPFFAEGERQVLVLFLDITAETAAHLRLRESEARARSILDTALDCIVSIDADGLIQEFNPAAERILGWRRVEAVGRSLVALIAPPGQAADHVLSPERLRSDDTVLGRRVELEVMHRDGHRLPVELAVTAVPLGPGRRYTAYLRDLSEAKRIRREVEDKTRILEAMMESVGIGIEVYDAEGQLLLANRRLAELLDLPPDMLRPGMRDIEVLRWLAEHGEYPGETVEESLADYDRLKRAGVCFSERRRPTGQWLQVRHFPMAGGGYVALFADVTEQKALETQLQQSQKMEALGQLAGGIAHDFNNLLSVIGGYAGMARQAAGGDGPVPTYLGKIQRGVDRAAALTRELLAFSRQKGGQARVVDLAAVVRDQEFLLKPLLGAGIRLTVTVPARPVWVAVDPDLAAQALVNLAINGRDAMAGDGPLAVRLEIVGSGPPGLEDRTCALLAVEDRGCGMDEVVKARIFDPFFTTKPPGQGTGLGLSMVYGVLKQANGAVTVESAPGTGACFRLWFPLAAEPDADPAGIAPESAGIDGGGACLLVAEDEPDLLEIIRTCLEAAGYRVRCATDGVEALERLEEGGVDLLLSDLVMPNLGGLRLTQLVRELYPDLPVVLMTGYAGRSGGGGPIDLPQNVPMIYKPFEPSHLSELIARTLAGQTPCRTEPLA
ncbi:PAS domain S-box protein [Oleisolibacter albus]|uniref:PAS domain-containing hybrid sensor histidine kinase/response regulator n=1 Tax=Oleisolibacter albus TaxID=2171757 RepID=UPI0013903604|nr:PAS domain S-box protein [Oleisolibacter albus]